MSLDKKTEKNIENETIENNNSIALKKESNAIINDSIKNITKIWLDSLVSELSTSNIKIWIKKELIKHKEELDKYEFEKIKITKNEISVYKEKWKAYIINNENILFLDKNDLFVYWELDWLDLDKKELYKMSLKKFLIFKQNHLFPKVYIYRNWEIIEWIFKDDNYIDNNWDRIRIFFWDIISNKKENIVDSILDISKIESIIWNVRINNIKRNWDLFLINLDTEFSNQNWIEVLYNYKTDDLLVKNEWNFIKDISLLKENIDYYSKFRSTFEYFKGNNMFDEPLNEEILENWKKEQLDWKLRESALVALRKGQTEYEFKWLTYPLYSNWKLSLPQVCIDYPLDFYEKINDSYYDNKWNHWEKLNFQNILWWFYNRRRVWYVIKKLLEWNNDINKYFTIEKIPEEYSIAYNDWENIENIIKNNISKLVSVWDIIFIEWKLSDWHLHRHSVMVSKIQLNWDIIIQENASYPSEESLIRVLSRWPKRKIKYIVKPTNLVK